MKLWTIQIGRNRNRNNNHKTSSSSSVSTSSATSTELPTTVTPYSTYGVYSLAPSSQRLKLPVTGEYSSKISSLATTGEEEGKDQSDNGPDCPSTSRAKQSRPETLYYHENVRRGNRLRQAHEKLLHLAGSPSSSDTQLTSRVSKTSVLLQQHSGVGVHQDPGWHSIFRRLLFK